jgi:hypothetical protein
MESEQVDFTAARQCGRAAPERRSDPRLRKSDVRVGPSGTQFTL